MSAATSMATFSDSPQSSEESVNTTIAVPNTRRVPKTVCHPAADRYAHGQAQYVTGDDRLEAERLDMKARRHGRPWWIASCSMNSAVATTQGR